MRRFVLLASLALLAGEVLDIGQAKAQAATRPPAGVVVKSNEYVLIAWNDLGMHCMNPRFAEICILPPYNTLRAIVLRRGEEPQIMTSGVNVGYWMDNNVRVAGKTDFWTYAPKLFGVNLPLGVGLAGNGLTGGMKVSAKGGFEAIGVPVLPYNDAGVWNPYQRATVAISIGRNQPIKNITSMVVPVSDELNCQKCHASMFSGATLESRILTGHDTRFGTKLMASRPVLCGGCHSDNALGTAGNPNLPSMSLAMHGKHASLPAAMQPACYDCHPGAKTQCNRSAAPSMGQVHGDPKCDTCHGNLQRMADGLRAGRKPWFEEPTCEQCHGVKYSTKGVLYKEAKGHGGVLCVACHNSPHAWWPSQRLDDNIQPTALQGSTHAIGYKACNVCHTDGRTGTMPPHSGDDGGGDGGGGGDD